MDFQQLWRLWRDQWGCGGLDLSFRQDVGSAQAAALYAIRYCQHQAGAKTQWLHEIDRLPRAFEVYGELRDTINGRAA